jgi:hypothetical protein
MRKSLISKSDLRQRIKIKVLLTTLISLVFTNLNPLPVANAAANPLEILSVTEVSDTSVELLFNSKISKSKIKHYVITATFDPLATNSPDGVILNSSNLVGSSTKKVLKVKSTGLISTKVNNLTSKAAYIFTVSAKMNQGKLITSEPTNYLPLSNLMDAVANLPADWGNPKPTQLPTPTPTTAPLAAPAFTLSSSSETRTVNTAATGFTVSSTGGAIASFAINATPPGMSFNTSTGALTGTPNTVAGATAYTITATNASGSATQTFTLTVTVAAPAFTLSSASETVTKNHPATGFTINSTGGTIASFAINATPPGMSFNTSTGALTGTPNTVAGATAYTITGTNTSGSATATFSLTVTVASYSIGSTGPGGGKIFYVTDTPFACGPTLASTCKYLEAAPISGINAWVDDVYTFSGNTATEIGVTAQGAAIGTGYKNTLAIVGQSGGGDTPNRAATVSRSYRGPNNLTDWYLPSINELTQLYLRQSTIGGFAAAEALGTGPLYDDFWSSTESGAETALIVWFDLTAGADGGVYGNSKAEINVVRPIRAFE